MLIGWLVWKTQVCQLFFSQNYEIKQTKSNNRETCKGSFSKVQMFEIDSVGKNCVISKVYGINCTLRALSIVNF